MGAFLTVVAIAAAGLIASLFILMWMDPYVQMTKYIKPEKKDEEA